MDVHVARTMALLGSRASVAAGNRLRAHGPCAIWEAAASWNVFDEAFLHRLRSWSPKTVSSSPGLNPFEHGGTHTV